MRGEGDYLSLPWPPVQEVGRWGVNFLCHGHQYRRGWSQRRPSIHLEVQHDRQAACIWRVNNEWIHHISIGKFPFQYSKGHLFLMYWLEVIILLKVLQCPLLLLIERFKEYLLNLSRIIYLMLLDSSTILGSWCRSGGTSVSSYQRTGYLKICVGLFSISN